MLNVALLDVTTNPEKLLFAAGRQCYSSHWVGDAWRRDAEGNVSLIDPEDGKQVTNKEIVGLLKHLCASGHTSVLEHVKFTFAIDGISRSETHQHVRHRLASYSQQSQRYVANYGAYNPDNYVVPPQIFENAEAYKIYEDTLMYIQEAYNKLKDLGVKSEDARYLMPNASVTRIVTTKNCVSLLHFFNLRCCTLAQWEIRNVANAMLGICREVLPVVFNDAGPRCKNLGYCPEDKKRSCGKFPTKKEVLEGYKQWKFGKDNKEFMQAQDNYVEEQIN